MIRIRLILAAMLLVLAAGCKRTAEGETAAWASNQQRLNDLMASYPQFRAALEETQRQAQQAWEAAQAVSDAEARLKAMADANAKAYPAFVRQLGSLQDDVKKLRAAVIDIEQLKLDEADRRAASKATQYANQAIGNVQRAISQGANSAAEANTLLGQAASELDEAVRNLDRVASTAKGKVDKADQQQKDQQAKTVEDEKKKEEAKTIKCAYCATVNEATTSHCKSCGAQLAKK